MEQYITFPVLRFLSPIYDLFFNQCTITILTTFRKAMSWPPGCQTKYSALLSQLTTMPYECNKYVQSFSALRDWATAVNALNSYRLIIHGNKRCVRTCLSIQRSSSLQNRSHCSRSGTWHNWEAGHSHLLSWKAQCQ